MTGEAQLKLFKGSIILAGRRATQLYREDYSTFGASEVYNHADAEGFIKLVGLSVKVRALVEGQ